MPTRLEQHGDLAILTLDRQEALNALSFVIIDEIGQAFDRAADMNVRALVVTGAGQKAFCAGADIPELRNRTQHAQRAGIELGQKTFAKLDTFPVPSIAVINGFALGGGLELAMACTFRLATRNAKMGLPEIKLGLTPGYGGTQRLPRLIGQARALEMVLTGRMIDAEEAYRVGLVNRLIDGDPLDDAAKFAGEFTKYGLPALKYAREAVERALSVPLHEGLKIEADLGTLAFRTADAEEGMAAFAEKRKPGFRDV